MELIIIYTRSIKTKTFKSIDLFEKKSELNKQINEEIIKRNQTRNKETNFSLFLV